MNVGVLARADDRGIGFQTFEFYRNVPGARALVVREPGAEARGFAPHYDRYPDSPVVAYDAKTGHLPETVVRDFLADLDVVYIVETPYDYRLLEWAHDAGCATVIHANPEFWHWSTLKPNGWAGIEQRRPDVWWLPTCWRADLLPDECRVVEVPVPTPKPLVDGFAAQRPLGPVWLHVAGHRAAADRNGTQIVYQAVRTMRERATVRVITQDAQLPSMRVPAHVTLDRVMGGVADRWSLYDGVDALVLPRRYGGLCLPALEAMACGIPLVMSDVEPQKSTWPIVPVAASPHREVVLPCGPVRTMDTNPRALSYMLDGLARDPQALAEQVARSREWARAHSWRALLPEILAELERAADALTLTG